MSATEAEVSSQERLTGREALRECPPSAKLVAKVLEYDGPLTQQELSEESLLPTRTVRYAVSQLEDVGVVQSRISFTDARKRVYRLDLE
jgi:DNA-binding MarR family transcriptional regulator